MNSLNTPFSADAITVFNEAVIVMLKGMIGIFIFMFVFYFLVKTLEHVFKNETKKE